MIRTILKLGGFVALEGAIVFACWNPAVAQTPSGAPCLSIYGAASTCSSATTDASTTTGPGSDPYPRTMAFEIGGDFALLHSGDTNAGVPLATVASESNMIVINDYLGVEKEGTYASLMQSWKAAAAAHGLTLRTFLYTEGDGVSIYLRVWGLSLVSERIQQIKHVGLHVGCRQGHYRPRSLHRLRRCRVIATWEITSYNKQTRPVIVRIYGQKTGACWPGTTSGIFTPDISTMYSSMGWHARSTARWRVLCRIPIWMAFSWTTIHESRPRLRPGKEWALRR